MSREDPWVCPICGKGPCVCTSFRHRVRELVDVAHRMWIAR